MQKGGSHCPEQSKLNPNNKNHQAKPDKHYDWLQTKYMAQLFKMTPTRLVSIQRKQHKQLKADTLELRVREEERKGRGKKDS